MSPNSILIQIKNRTNVPAQGAMYTSHGDGSELDPKGTKFPNGSALPISP